MSAIDISHLSRQQRLDLISALCESLDGDELPISDAWAAELDRRLSTFDTDKQQGKSWDEIKRMLRPAHD